MWSKMKATWKTKVRVASELPEAVKSSGNDGTYMDCEVVPCVWIYALIYGMLYSRKNYI